MTPSGAQPRGGWRAREYSGEPTGDPRRAILERYPDRDRYLALVEQAAKPLIAAGYLRAEDLGGIRRRAGERWRVLVEERAER